MAGKPKEPKDVSETNEDQDPDEMMIPGPSGTSTTEAKSKTKKNSKKKSAGKQPRKPKKSDEQQGRKQTKITEYLATNATKQQQPAEIPADKPESQQDDQDEDQNDEDLIEKSKKMKNTIKKTNKNKKKSRRIQASSDHEDEEDSSQATHNKSINEFDRIQQQLAQIEMLRVEFAKGPDISEVIGKRAETELDPKDPNQSLLAENDVAPEDSDSDSEIIDLKQYFFKKSQYKRIRRSLRTIAPKPPPAAEDSAKCTKNDFLQLFILGHVPGTGNPNPNPQDPFNIGQILFDEKIFDQNRNWMWSNLWKCCSTFMKLIRKFTQNAVEDGVLKIRRSDPKNREPSPEDHQDHHPHHHGRYVNDAQILQQYVNLYARNARRLMINDAVGAENPEDAVRSNGSRGGSRSAPLFVYCLLAQEICLKTLKQQKLKNNRKYEDDGDRGRRRSTFIIDLLTTFPTIPDYASTITTTMMMDPNDLDQIKRNKCCCCCWLLKQLSAILIIGLFDCSQTFQLDQLDKFFELLDLIITLQSKMLDCCCCCCLTNQVETDVVPKVLSDHVDPNDDHDDHHDDDDGQVDDHHDEYDQTLSLYLFLLYICLSLKTFYHAKDKFGLAAEDSSSSDSSGSTTINSVQRSFMVYDHLRSMFSKLFQTFTGYNRKRVFQKFFELVFRWHTMDNNPIMVQMDPINILKSSSRSSSREDRICIQLIILIETFSQLMLFLPQWLAKTGEHLHLFWMLFTLIKLKCCSGSGTESSSESDAAEPPPICRTFEQAIQPMIDIVWRELPFGCQIYLVHFISAYVTRFGTNPFILNLCKTLFNIPGMDFKFRSMISALSMDL